MISDHLSVIVLMFLSLGDFAEATRKTHLRQQHLTLDKLCKDIMDSCDDCVQTQQDPTQDGQKCGWNPTKKNCQDENTNPEDHTIIKNQEGCGDLHNTCTQTHVPFSAIVCPPCPLPCAACLSPHPLARVEPPR